MKDWEGRPFAAKYVPMDGVCRSQCQGFLERFVIERQQLDCLAIGGWQPKENQLSDVVAAVFEPTWHKALSQLSDTK